MNTYLGTSCTAYTSFHSKPQRDLLCAFFHLHFCTTRLYLLFQNIVYSLRLTLLPQSHSGVHETRFSNQWPDYFKIYLLGLFYTCRNLTLHRVFTVYLRLLVIIFAKWIYLDVLICLYISCFFFVLRCCLLKPNYLHVHLSSIRISCFYLFI